MLVRFLNMTDRLNEICIQWLGWRLVNIDARRLQYAAHRDRQRRSP